MRYKASVQEDSDNFELAKKQIQILRSTLKKFYIEALLLNADDYLEIETVLPTDKEANIQLYKEDTTKVKRSINVHNPFEHIKFFFKSKEGSPFYICHIKGARYYIVWLKSNGSNQKDTRANPHGTMSIKGTEYYWKFIYQNSTLEDTYPENTNELRPINKEAKNTQFIKQASRKVQLEQSHIEFITKFHTDDTFKHEILQRMDFDSIPDRIMETIKSKTNHDLY